jgi:hypothetical protein
MESPTELCQVDRYHSSGPEYSLTASSNPTNNRQQVVAQPRERVIVALYIGGGIKSCNINIKRSRCPVCSFIHCITGNVMYDLSTSFFS